MGENTTLSCPTRPTVLVTHQIFSNNLIVISIGGGMHTQIGHSVFILCMCIYLFLVSVFVCVCACVCVCVWPALWLCFRLQLWPYANTAWQSGMPPTSLPIELCPIVITTATETIAQVDMKRCWGAALLRCVTHGWLLWSFKIYQKNSYGTHTCAKTHLTGKENWMEVFYCGGFISWICTVGPGFTSYSWIIPRNVWLVSKI